MFVSEQLKIKWDGGANTRVPNRSGLYWDVFIQWWELGCLEGNGLLVGEEFPDAHRLKHFFRDRYEVKNEIVCASLSDSDIDWDITRRLELTMQFNFIVCQAVLEHVVDPVAAVNNMANVLKGNGNLFIHSHGPHFKEHRHPIDCYRFLRDGVIALSTLSNTEIIDILWTPSHWFLWLKRNN